MKKIKGLIIKENIYSKRIIEIQLKKETINELINLFKRFDLTAIEYKPFTRFTIAKYLDDLTGNSLSIYLNDILRDRKTGNLLIILFLLPSSLSDNFCKKIP